MIAQDTERLGELYAKLKLVNRQSAVLWDMYEAAATWHSFGQLIMDRKPWEGLQDLALQNEEQRDQLIAAYGEQIAAETDFVTIMECGARLIAVGKLMPHDPRGYLGYVDIVRDTFAFLESRHGFVWTDVEGAWPGYVRGPLKITLYGPDDRPSRLLQLDRLVPPSQSYEVADLLYASDPTMPLEPWEPPTITTTGEARTAYAAMADLLRQHCADLLADAPGALDRLDAASRLRERLLIEMYDRLYGPGTPPDP